MCCAFCREPLLVVEDIKGYLVRLHRRIAMSDGEVMYILTGHYRDDEFGFPKDEKETFELYHWADTIMPAFVSPTFIVWGVCRSGQ